MAAGCAVLGMLCLESSALAYTVKQTESGATVRWHSGAVNLRVDRSMFRYFRDMPVKGAIEDAASAWAGLPGVPELLIILAVVLLLFGGARLAGIGKSTGRAIKEFKEETKGLKESDRPESLTPPPVTSDSTYQQPPTGNATDATGSEPRRDV